MADTYDLSGQGYGLAGMPDPVALQPVADGAQSLAKAFAELAEAEGKALLEAKRTAEQNKKMVALEAQLQRSAAEWYTQKDREREATTKAAAVSKSFGASVVSAFDLFGGRAAKAISSIYGFGEALLGLPGQVGAAASRAGHDANPALGGAVDDAFGLLKNTLMTAFMPAVVSLGAAALVAADYIRDMSFAAAEFIKRLGGGASGLWDRFKESDVGRGSIGRGGGLDKVLGWFGMSVEDREQRGMSGGEISKGAGSRDKSAFESAMQTMVRSMEIKMGQGQPAFEGPAEAFRRIQMAEAGMTDVQREIRDLNRAQLDMLRKLAGMKTYAEEKLDKAVGNLGWGSVSGWS